jgi:hypothetical protein
MYAGLYFGALLSLTPLILTFCALRMQIGLNPQPPRWRTIVFRIGLLSSLICAVTSVRCWLDFKFNVLLAPALSTAFLTFISAFVGRRSSRLLLCGAAVIQLVIAYLAILQNGV